MHVRIGECGMAEIQQAIEVLRAVHGVKSELEIESRNGNAVLVIR